MIGREDVCRIRHQVHVLMDVPTLGLGISVLAEPASWVPALVVGSVLRV